MTTKKKTTTTAKAAKPAAAKKTTTKAAAPRAKKAAVTEPAVLEATAKAETKIETVSAIAPEVPATASAADTVEIVTSAAAPQAPKAEKAPEAATPASVTVETSTEKPVLTIGMFQKRLYERGYYLGQWDGHYGPMTKQAVAHFQHDNGLWANGDATPETIAALGL
jgi:peptidoglycan hydrolase-like protein with peptidoglycan-binding domain